MITKTVTSTCDKCKRSIRVVDIVEYEKENQEIDMGLIAVNVTGKTSYVCRACFDTLREWWDSYNG